MDFRSKQEMMAGAGSKRTKKRATRRRRRAVEQMWAAGRRVDQIARLLRCPTQTVRQHVDAIRDAARRRAVARWGPGAAENGDLVEAIEDALQKVRGAQGESDPAKPTHRSLLQLELKTLGDMIDLRRTLAAARLSDPADDWRLPHNLSTEELLEEGRRLGLDTSGFERALRLVKGSPKRGSGSKCDVDGAGEVTSTPEARVQEQAADASALEDSAADERPRVVVCPPRQTPGARARPEPAADDPSALAERPPLSLVSRWCPILPDPDER